MIISILFGLLTLLVGYLTLFLQRAIYKALFYLAFVILFIFTWQSTLGIAMPADLNVFHQKGQIIAQRLDEPNAIYIWVMLEHSTKPYAIQLPWSTATAQQLHDAEKTHMKMIAELPSLKEKIAGKLRSIGGEPTAEKKPGVVGDKDGGPPNGPKPDDPKLGKPDPTKSFRDRKSPSLGAMIYPDMQLEKLAPKQPIDN